LAPVLGDPEDVPQEQSGPSVDALLVRLAHPASPHPLFEAASAVPGDVSDSDAVSLGILGLEMQG